MEEVADGWRVRRKAGKENAGDFGASAPSRDFLPIFVTGGEENVAETRDFLDIARSFRDA